MIKFRFNLFNASILLFLSKQQRFSLCQVGISLFQLVGGEWAQAFKFVSKEVLLGLNALAFEFFLNPFLKLTRSGLLGQIWCNLSNRFQTYICASFDFITSRKICLNLFSCFLDLGNILRNHFLVQFIRLLLLYFQSFVTRQFNLNLLRCISL